MNAQQFRKKPVVIEAIHWDGENFEAVLDFIGEDYVGSDRGPGFDDIHIATLEGSITATRGDWVIRGIKGEHYSCKPDIFEATYDLVAASSDTPGKDQDHG